MEEKIEKPTLSQLWQDIKKHKFVYFKVLAVTFVVSAIIALSIPNYYKCTVMLAPELSGAKGSSSLANLASSFGVNLGSSNSGMDAIVPTLYPDLMNSVTFKTSLFPVKVQREDEDSAMTYYDYLKNHQRKPWWSAATQTLLSLLKAPEKEKGPLNPFRLTKEQSGIIEVINKKVVCDVDNKTMVITIDVTDQDPLIAASIADSVQLHLQEFITDYRTRKARVDLEYNKKLFAEAKARYEKARRAYASYADANRNILFESVKSERTKLENEMQLQYQSYSRIAAQLQLSEAKVQEETPAFTTLQPASVPVKKAGPKRTVMVLALLFLAIIITTFYILKKENRLKSILESLRRDSRQDMFDDEEYYILSKYPPHQADLPSSSRKSK